MFYLFSQNNSGGSFDVDDRVAENVIIEASSARQANQIAEDLGIYFNGVEDGSDCSCCGDRWYEVRADDAMDEPLIYGEDPRNDNIPSLVDKNKPFCHIYYTSGYKDTIYKDRS